MTPTDADDLAARTLAAIDAANWPVAHTDRERVASDLAGFNDHREMRCCYDAREPNCSDATRYADGLRRTAALYGVTP